MALARVEDDPDCNAALFSGAQRLDDNRIREGVGREVDGLPRGGDQLDVDCVELLFGREVDFLRCG